MDIIERLQVRVRARAGNILYPGEPGIEDPLLADTIAEIERLRARLLTARRIMCASSLDWGSNIDLQALWDVIVDGGDE